MRVLWFGLVLAFAVTSGCASSIPNAKFQHAVHGVVPADHPELESVRVTCGLKAYAEGIKINGTVVTSRAVAIEAYTKHLMDQVYQPGAGAIAGTQGALAVATGNPELATSTSSSRSQITKPPFNARYEELEKKTWDCVNAAGWTRLQS